MSEEDKKHIREGLADAYSQLDKALLTLSSSALAFSLAFLKFFVPDYSALENYHFYLLLWPSWFFLPSQLLLVCCPFVLAPYITTTLTKAKPTQQMKQEQNGATS